VFFSRPIRDEAKIMPLFASSDVERRYLDLYYDEREVDVLQVRFLTLKNLCTLNAFTHY